MLPPFCFTNDLASATVGQGKIAHDGVEVLRSQECKGAFHIVGGGNGMTEVPEQASQDTAGVNPVLPHPHPPSTQSAENSPSRDLPSPFTHSTSTARLLFFTPA